MHINSGFGKSISQLNVALVIKKIKIYGAKYLFIKNLNQILRHLKSCHCSCLGRLGQNCHPSHFIFLTFYIHLVTLRTSLAKLNGSPLQLVIRDQNALAAWLAHCNHLLWQRGCQVDPSFNSGTCYVFCVLGSGPLSWEPLVRQVLCHLQWLFQC